MKTLAIIILTAALSHAMTIHFFSPSEAPPSQQPAAGLLSPAEYTEIVKGIQTQINAVHARYGRDTIKVDGIYGHGTTAAHIEAYSLQETEKEARVCYE